MMQERKDFLTAAKFGLGFAAMGLAEILLAALYIAALVAVVVFAYRVLFA